MSVLKECDVMAVRKVEGNGNLKAFVDIRIAGSLIVRGCTVIEGKKGLFASLPKKLSRDGRWNAVIVPQSEELISIYEDRILKAFKAGSDGSESEPSEDNG